MKNYIFYTSLQLALLLGASMTAFAGNPVKGAHAVAAVAGNAIPPEEHKTLPIGAAAPDFHLPGVDGKTYTLASFREARVLVIVFMCNHCPTSQAYEDRVIRLTNDYTAKGVSVVAINPNDPASLRLDELGYSDLGDSYAEMKIRAKNAGFNFPYLYDGETETASKAYGPVSTPHVFVFDKDRKLRYNGRFDDREDPKKKPGHEDTRDAIDALLSGREIAVTVTPVFGCSVKWAEKRDWIDKAAITWAKEPVRLDTIDVAGVTGLLTNPSGKIRLINVWATWCGPCVEEFPELVTIHRMYRDRGFELVSISTDETDHRTQALRFLQNKQASSPNYIYTGEDKYKLMAAIDPKWQGGLPYSMLVDPDGTVVYRKQGIIDPEELKKIIFDDRFMGRIYKEDTPAKRGTAEESLKVRTEAKRVAPRFNVLALYENGGHHLAYSKRARVWLDQLAVDSNFRIDYIQRPDTIDGQYLKNYQLILQLDYPPYGWKDKAVTAFEQYIEEGRGGWVGFHHSTLLGKFDGFPMWQWFSGFMGGIEWKNYIPDFADGEVMVEDGRHPVMRGVPDSFLIRKEEWYTYNKSPRPNVHVIARVNEGSYTPQGMVKMGDHPVIWTNEHVKARNVYIFMGHSPDLFDDEQYKKIFSNAIFWAAGK
ncbi:MAG TPA: ThuA domain-containing protein [Puia sp.]|nr:ThuA domain-containing protein [Puia sp.]